MSDQIIDTEPETRTSQAASPTGPGQRLTSRIGTRLRMDRYAMVAAILLVVIVLASLLAPVIAPFNPDEADFTAILSGPGATHWLGTDQLGRDVFTRLLFAGRVSLLASLLAVGVGLVLGVVPGLISGYVGGRIDMVASRVADLLLSFPSLVLAIGIVAALGAGLVPAMFAVGVAFSPRFYRLVRGQVLVAKSETFVLAAKSVGLPPWRILNAHVLPVVWGPLVIQASFALGLALIVEASLSFLGLGVQPPQASWGVMIGNAKSELARAPWLVVVPGLAIFVTVLSFNTVGDAVRDAMTLRGRDD